MRQYLVADDTRQPRDRIVGMLRGEGQPQARGAGRQPWADGSAAAR